MRPDRRVPIPAVLVDAELIELAGAVGLASPGSLGASLDALAVLARASTAADRALVNLIAGDRILHRGRAPANGPGERPAAHGFCPYVVATERVLAVPDTRVDERTRDNPAVAEGAIAYLGAPLFLGTRAVGTVCVFSDAPRPWTVRQQEALVELAERAARRLTELELL